VRGVGGALARLYRGRLDRDARGDRRRAHPRQRHRGAEAQMAPAARLRRGAADGGLTEPNTGSDLASLRTRATRSGDTYTVHGNKTWITHPVAPT